MEPKGTTTTPAPTTTTSTTAAPEPFKRPESLYFVGERLPNGEPVQHLAGYGIDARDYEKGDPWLARLKDDQLQLALDSGLYQRTKPKARDAGDGDQGSKE